VRLDKYFHPGTSGIIVKDSVLPQLGETQVQVDRCSDVLCEGKQEVRDSHPQKKQSRPLPKRPSARVPTVKETEIISLLMRLKSRLIILVVSSIESSIWNTETISWRET